MSGSEAPGGPALGALGPDGLRAAASLVRPTPRQVRWARRELMAFLHVGMNTVTGREWGTGREDPALFDLPRADCAQWARVLAAAGATAVVLTAKHHDGFCLWPSRYTRHSVAASRWRSGRGDLVRELVEAARAQGLAVGVYLSPADLHQRHVEGRYGDGSAPRPVRIPTPVPGDDRADALADGRLPVLDAVVDTYNQHYLDQLYELLTDYGPIDEVWLDGADPEGGSSAVPQVYDRPAWYRLVRRLAPGAVVFGGPDARWVGNESGVARSSEWSVVAVSGADLAEGGALAGGEQDADLGSPDALARGDRLAWCPAEVDVSIRPGWFHHPEQDDAVKSPAQLLEVYERSVGRNAVLLLNVPPTREGLLAEADVAALEGFARRRREVFHDGALRARVERDDGGTTTAHLPQGAAPVDVVVLSEGLHRGQQVEEFVVEALPAGAGAPGGGWVRVAGGTTVGHHRVLRLDRPCTAGAVRVRVTAARGPHRLHLSLHTDPRAGEAAHERLSLDAARNSTTSTVDHDRARGEVGPERLSLSVAALSRAGVAPGGHLDVDGLRFRWPLVSPGAPDAVLPRGQELELSGTGHRLGLLWVSTGAGLPGYLQVLYADGDVTEVAVGRFETGAPASGAAARGGGGGGTHDDAGPAPVPGHPLRPALPGARLHDGLGAPHLLVQEVRLRAVPLVGLRLPVVDPVAGTHLVAVAVEP